MKIEMPDDFETATAAGASFGSVDAPSLSLISKIFIASFGQRNFHRPAPMAAIHSRTEHPGVGFSRPGG
jgi:hypothetical protein